MGEVGGNSLGLYGCAFSPDGTGVISHGFQGAFHYWKFVNSQVRLQILPTGPRRILSYSSTLSSLSSFFLCWGFV